MSSAFGRERSSEFAHTIGFWWSVSGLEYYMKYVDEMGRQTPAQLVDYARKYIIDRPHITGVLLSRDAQATLKLTEDELAQWGAPATLPAKPAKPAAPAATRRPATGAKP